jgi:UDP-GlcNAc:undecaprenyl-phosphate GlcNAc-1-phosphate transferase
MIGSFLYASPPASMFLGDSGSQALGILMASIGIAYTPAQAGLPQETTWFIPILVLGVPIFDMILVIMSRLRRQEPIYKAATDHTYHRLRMAGFHSNRAVLVMQIAAIFLSITSFLILGVSPLGANLIFIFIVIVGVITAIFLEWKYARLLSENGEH